MSVAVAPRPGRPASMSGMIPSVTQTICGPVLKSSSALTIRQLVKEPPACCLSVKACPFRTGSQGRRCALQ